MPAYDRYYDVVRRIPEGRVTTYGAVASLAARDGRARQVGYAMAALPHGTDVPWHRVINARGEISPRGGGSPGGLIQRQRLEGEGVTFDHHGRVDLDTFGWP